MKKLYFLLLCLMLSACSVGPPYVPPEVDIPVGWKNGAVGGEDNSLCYCEPFWWSVFQDDRLNELEALALENNRNLYAAYERIERARAMVGIAASQFYPQVYLNPQYTSTGELIKNYVNPNNPSLNGVTDHPMPFRVHELFYFLPMTFNYEVDLWGKIRDQYASAKYTYQAQKDDYNGVMLTLTANLATAYYQLRTTDKQIDLLTYILKTREKALKINSDRYEEEIIFYSDVTLAAGEVDSARILLEEAVRQRALYEDQIAVLIGVSASEFTLEPMPLSGMPPVIPSGIPSEVLLRRPDIARAENIMLSSHAMVKYVYAQFFPSLSLTSVLGFESPVLKEFMKWISRYWMVGVASSQLIFDGFKTSSALAAEVARFKEASADYQQQVLIAFQEVEDALASLGSYARQYDVSLDRVVWREKTFKLYSDRYKLGVINYIDVVNTERDALNAQIDANALQGLNYLTTIQFIQALGGGWEQDCAH